MSSKRQQMRERAKKQLEVKEPSKSDIKPEDESPPSFFKGFIYIFLGMFATVFFFSINQVLLGIFAGAPFIIIGTSRITKASAIENKTTIEAP